ncbi:WW domain protein, putative [Medicago truncatula]|nr:WW domain protein, putative [Medicago truncatula]
MQNLTSMDVEYSEKTESDVALGNLQNEIVSKDQTDASENFDERDGNDTSSGWKMVLHEESQHYYYWNVLTGETSWEVPQVLAQADHLTNDPLPPASVNDKTDNVTVGVDNSNMLSAAMLGTSAAFTVDETVETSVISHKDLHDHGSQMNGCSEECTNENKGSNIHGDDLIRNDDLMSLSYGGDHSIGVEEQQVEIDFPSRLVQQTESLLEMLKSLENGIIYRSKGNLQGQDSLSKYMLELEIRLSDFRSLSSYGSSLLPFWVHSDRKIKVLECLINVELLQTDKSEHAEVEDKPVPVAEEFGEQPNGVGQESEVDHNEKKGSFLTSEVSIGSQTDASVEALKDVSDKFSSDAQRIPLSISTGSHAETSLEVSTQIEATINPEESTHENVCNIGEDVDMDVDMEVEDMNSSENTVLDASVANDYVQTDQPFQSNPQIEYHSLLPEDAFAVPPPPDDEWIPPPPPDNEHMPPPPPPDDDQMPPLPPGDPLATCYHVIPSYTETGQSLSYAQYNPSYLGASSEYYGQTAAEVPTSNIYGQIAMQPAQLYYSAVPNIYSENPQVMINPTDPVTYYEAQDGAGLKPIPDINISDSGGVSGADSVSSDIPSTSAAIHDPATVSVDASVSLAPATTEVNADKTTSSLAAKAQTKVVRSRKRAVAVGSSLKSNKKVSSLVDKWKAAKEELLEEEEEPESVYDALERKRQREIEEWRAKQIASGEAKDNANFQPLGGDWREKVRRKRAKAAKETVGKVEVASESSKQQKPDIVELAKGLPSNWQAYWDEASKKVYYGNVVTSETTWTRPTR